MRGKEEFAKAEGIRIGITPAYAGKSHFALPNKVCIWDHPRLCGEKDRCGNCRNGKIGSPPPMRGKVLHFVQSTQRNRITPAYAGKRCVHAVFYCRFEDHPRLCGEKANHCAFRLQFAGSPPPMRGKEDCVYNHVCDEGITPAYAGKSSGSWCQPLSDRDHPRLCGEKSRYSVTLWITAGSPPPMRGKE